MVFAMLVQLCGCALVSKIDASGSAEPPRAKFEAESLHTPAPLPEEPEEIPEDLVEDTEGEGEQDVKAEYPQIKEDDPMYGDVCKMVKGLTPIFSDFALEGEDKDLSTLGADDFWMLMAMIAAEMNGEEKNSDGSVTLHWDVVSDYSATFFSDLFLASGIPDWKDTKSASSDPRSQLIYLTAMEIDGYHGRLAGFCEDPEKPGYYDLYQEIYWSVIEGVDAGTSIDENIVWKIVLEPWFDEAQHEFAFRMVSYEHLEKADEKEEVSAN